MSTCFVTSPMAEGYNSMQSIWREMYCNIPLDIVNTFEKALFWSRNQMESESKTINLAATAQPIAPLIEYTLGCANLASLFYKLG